MSLELETQGVLVAVRSKVHGIVVVREWQNKDAQTDLVLSLSLAPLVAV